MWRIICILSIAAMCVITTGCSEREQVGGGYYLVVGDPAPPDYYPSTALFYKGTSVWARVSGFYPDPPKKFYHEGMFVFIGSVPGATNWCYQPQIFAVRGAGPAVVLSERLFGRPMLLSDTGPVQSNYCYSVRNLAAISNGISFDMAYWYEPFREDTLHGEMPWTQVKQMLDDAPLYSRPITNKLGVYYILPRIR